MANSDGRLRAGHFDLDERAHLLSLQGKPLTLTRAQFEILRYLLSRAGEVVKPGEIVSEVWGVADVQSGPLVQVHVCNIRRALGENGREPRYLRTVRGYGYMLIPDGNDLTGLLDSEPADGKAVLPATRGWTLSVRSDFPGQWRVSHSPGVRVHKGLS